MSEKSFVHSRFKNASASFPCTVISPMWETSKTPHASRTALCSARIALYCTGKAHPPNSTILPPSLIWFAYSGVCFASCIQSLLCKSCAFFPVFIILGILVKSKVGAQKTGARRSPGLFCLSLFIFHIFRNSLHSMVFFLHFIINSLFFSLLSPHFSFFLPAARRLRRPSARRIVIFRPPRIS